MAPAEGEPPQRVVVVGRDDTYGAELAGALTAELAARGAETVVVSYPSRRVELSAEGAEVAAANGDVVVAITAAEAPRLLAAMIDAGVPANRIVGLDGMYVPRIAEQTFPDDPARLDGLTVIASTGDRAFEQSPGVGAGVAGPGVLRRPDVRLRRDDGAGGGRRRLR